VGLKPNGMLHRALAAVATRAIARRAQALTRADA
jgi:hypothetical protein